MRILILRSGDGQDYSMPVVLPEHLSDEEAEQLTRQVIEEVKAAWPDDWGFGEIRPRLEKKGFLLPKRILLGPYWD